MVGLGVPVVDGADGVHHLGGLLRLVAALQIYLVVPHGIDGGVAGLGTGTLSLSGPSLTCLRLVNNFKIINKVNYAGSTCCSAQYTNVGFCSNLRHFKLAWLLSNAQMFVLADEKVCSRFYKFLSDSAK